MKPSKKNLESLDSPKYLQIPSALLPSSLAYSPAKPRKTSHFLNELSLESPFKPLKNSNNSSQIPAKSAHNILKASQEYQIGEDPAKRAAFSVKTRLPPLEVYK